MEDALAAEGVVVARGCERALKGVDLAVERRELVGVIGPNGAGKSTLLRVLTGALEPSAGRALLMGRPVLSYDARERARLLAVVPEEPHVPFAFTVEELVLMGRSPYASLLGGSAERDGEVARRAMVSCGILHLAGRPVTALSAGERQRAFLAQGLAQEPEVLVLDEPTTHLDLRQRLSLFELLARLNSDEGLTVLCVLHDLGLAARFCSRLVLVDAGRLVADGAPSDVLTPALIAASFGVRVAVRRDPSTGRPVVSPLGGGALPRLSGRVHVVCGGGCAEATLRDLAGSGLSVSCGVLGRGDSDAEAARALGLVAVEEEPFSPVGHQARERNRSLMREAGAVVLEEAPYGPGNLANLEDVAAAAEGGASVVVVETDDIGERDFTGGEASRLYARLRSRARVVRSRGDLLGAVAEALKSGGR